MQVWPSRPQWLNLRVGVASVGVLLVVFSWLLTNEIAVWRDTPALYLETIKRSPGASVIAHDLGRYDFNSNDLERAQEWEMKALAASEKSFIENKPNLAGIYEGLGAICFKKGKLTEARDYNLKAYEETPGEQTLMQNLATLYIALREYGKALPLLEGVVRANPRNEVAYSDMSALYAAAGQFDLAIENARRALDINPKYSNALLNLARAYAGKGMKEEARRAYLDLQRIDPAKAGQADAELKALISR
ncbi:MAG: tetratricopeptide repeat protein [Acidobacteriota bacterium]|jgi:tetratricopeptide (TPR) repeat protein